jgi:hypothetical protein
MVTNLKWNHKIYDKFGANKTLWQVSYKKKRPMFLEIEDPESAKYQTREKNHLFFAKLITMYSSLYYNDASLL